MDPWGLQGHGHFESIGFCPHCNSSNIRLRRDPLDADLWRCRRCNRTFRTPKRAEAWVDNQTAQRRGIVYTNAIPKMERRARLRQQRRRQRRPSSQKGIIVGVIILLTGALFLGWQYWGLGTLLSSEPVARETLPTPTMTPRPYIVVPTVAPTPVPPPAERHLREKEYMLELINAERANAGVGAVILGSNIAAQLHAEAALEHCFGSHWGVDGLKPYMRYSLGGGYQANAENAHGADYCITGADGYRRLGEIRKDIDDAIGGWMNSPGHRRNVLDPLHKKVNIGIAWDRYNFKAFQHFEGDYVTFTAMPAINNGVLSMAGEFKNGAEVHDLQDLGVQIYYDPPPEPLTLGQVSRTYCYDNGLQVASLRESLTGGEYWASATFTQNYSPCPDPYDVSPTAPAAASPDEADRLWQYAYDQSESRLERFITVPWVTAKHFTVQHDTFTIEADVGWILHQRGPGVYTISVWASVGGEDAVVAEYSIFYEIERPDTYTS